MSDLVYVILMRNCFLMRLTLFKNMHNYNIVQIKTHNWTFFLHETARTLNGKDIKPY